MSVQERKNICSSGLTSKLCRPSSSSNGLSFSFLTNFAFPAINYCPDNPEMCTPGRKLVNFFQFGMTLQTNQGMSGKEIELLSCSGTCMFCASSPSRQDCIIPTVVRVKILIRGTMIFMPLWTRRSTSTSY